MYGYAYAFLKVGVSKSRIKYRFISHFSFSRCGNLKRISEGNFNPYLKKKKQTIILEY